MTRRRDGGQWASLFVAGLSALMLLVTATPFTMTRAAFTDDTANPGNTWLAGEWGPTVEIVTPVDGATLSGSVTLTAAVISGEVDGVTFELDGVQICAASNSGGQWSCQWDSTTADNDVYTLTAHGIAGAAEGTSHPHTITVANVPPATPTGLAATSGVSEQVPLTWDAATGAQTYDVQYRAVGGGTWTPITGITGTGLTVTALPATTSYDFQVRSVNAYGASAWSATATATPAPPRPTGLVAISEENTFVPTSWNAASGATTYDLRHKRAADSTWTTIAGLTATSRTVEDLTNDVTYDFQVRAVNSGGASAWSATVQATPRALMLYLKTNGAPGANTATVLDLPMSGAFPAWAETLPNYSTDEGNNQPGRHMHKGSPSDTEKDKNQWWTFTAANTVQLNGPATLTFWAAMKDLDTSKEGSVTAWLMHCNSAGGSCTNLGPAAGVNLYRSRWAVNGVAWSQGTINFGPLNHTLAAGRTLRVRVQVAGNSGDGMWFAYDTTTYPSVLRIGN
jgi:hypothetical protein